MGRVDSMKKKTMSYFCAGWMGGVGRVDSTIIVNKEREVCVGLASILYLYKILF